MLEKANFGTNQGGSEKHENKKLSIASISDASSFLNSNSGFSKILSEIVGKTVSVCGISDGKYICIEILEIDGNYIHGFIAKGRQEIYISVASIVFLIRNTPESRRRYFSRFGGGDFAMKITSSSFVQYS